MQETSAPALFDRLTDCRGWIEAALGHADGTHTFDDVAGGVLTGRFHLWHEPDACVVTEFVNYPRKRALNAFLAGGNLETIRRHMAAAELFARENGCDIITMTGRRGWVRALSPDGWVETHTSMKRVLR